MIAAADNWGDKWVDDAECTCPRLLELVEVRLPILIAQFLQDLE
jgi:hypothetical protein